jgi:type 1 glutamine amidotransferase
MGDTSRPRRKLLLFSRSVLFEHPVIARRNGALSFAEQRFVELAGDLGCEVHCTKDGRVFDDDLAPYAAVVSYSCGRPADLMKAESKDGAAPLTRSGWENLDRTVRAGKPLVGIHPGLWLLPEAFQADCIGHGSQQVARTLVASPRFPGLAAIPESFTMLEEWFSLTRFGRDLHVILVQDCGGMSLEQPADRKCYDRPPFPATWARMHDQGRVFYTSLGHREDVWTSAVFRQVLLAGLAWALGDVDADVPPNISQVSPQASALDAVPV